MATGKLQQQQQQQQQGTPGQHVSDTPSQIQDDLLLFSDSEVLAYLTAAIDKLQLSGMPGLRAADLQQQLLPDSSLQLMMRLQQLPALWCIRMAMAPVLETVILLDRWLYVLEPDCSVAVHCCATCSIEHSRHMAHSTRESGTTSRGHDGESGDGKSTAGRIVADLVQLFDPVVSPRSMALVCMKV